MIQRIQTLYLSIVIILMGLMFFYPTINVVSNESIDYSLSFLGFRSLNDNNALFQFSTTLLSILNVIIPLITILTIPLFRHRIAQIRLSIFNMILMVGYYGLFIWIVFFIIKNNIEGTFSYNWPIILPLISIILTYLAVRAIGKDEAMVQSYYRLR